MASPTIEILYFPGCPHHAAARELVERSAAEAVIDTNLRLVEVTSGADAERIGILGSPTVRMNGHTYSFDSRSVITICTMSETVS